MSKLSRGAVYFLKQRGIEVVSHDQDIPLLTNPDLKYISSYSEEYRHACEVVSLIRMGDLERNRFLDNVPLPRRQLLVQDINKELNSRFVYISIHADDTKQSQQTLESKYKLRA